MVDPITFPQNPDTQIPPYEFSPESEPLKSNNKVYYRWEVDGLHGVWRALGMEGEPIEEIPDSVTLKTPEILYPPKGAANEDYNARSKNIISKTFIELGGTPKAPKDYSYQKIVWGNDKFVVSSRQNASDSFMYSQQDISLPWKQAGGASDYNFYGLAYSPVENRYLAVNPAGQFRLYFSEESPVSFQRAADALTNGGWTSVCWGDGKWVGVGLNSFFYSTGPLDERNSTKAYRDPTTFSNAGWDSIIYANNRYVAVTSSGPTYNRTDSIMYSDTALSGSWKAVSLTSGYWMDLAYGNNTFVSVSYGGTKRIAYSTNNAKSWTAIKAPGDSGWQSVTYGDDKFVAVARTGTNRVMYSYDGINDWTLVSVPEGSWMSVTYGGGYFCAVSNTDPNRIMYSKDGINWDDSKKNLEVILNGSQTLNHATGDDLGMTIDQTFKMGDKVTSDDSSVTGTLIDDADRFGPKMEITNLVGDWTTANFVYNTETKTSYGPDADTLQFVASIPDTVSGSVTNWGAATWSVSKNSDMSDPMVAQKAIAPGSEQILEPSERGDIVLEPDTQYYATVQYSSGLPISDSEVSERTDFETKPTGARTGDTNIKYYDAQNDKLVSIRDIIGRFGDHPQNIDIKKYGIYELTEQPQYEIEKFVREGNKYKPIIDYGNVSKRLTEELNRLESNQ